jgi:hypothetical protein
LEEFICPRRGNARHSRKNLCKIECENMNVVARLSSMKECLLDTLSDSVGTVERTARKPWITQEIISKINERKKWKNVNSIDGRHRRKMKEKLKGGTDKAKRNYFKIK